MSNKSPDIQSLKVMFLLKYELLSYSTNNPFRFVECWFKNPKGENFMCFIKKKELERYELESKKVIQKT